MAPGGPAAAGATQAPEPVDPAADVGVSLADLRETRDGLEQMLVQYDAQVAHLRGRKAAIESLIAPLEAELAKPKPKPRAPRGAAKK